MRPFAGITEQSKAAIHRRDDARALLGQGRWRGAMYLAGYSLECTLKALLMKKFEVSNLDALELLLKEKHLLPTAATMFDHRIELYVQAGGALKRLQQNEAGWRRYVVANSWSPSWRYSPDLSNPDDAGDFLAAIDDVLAWLNANL